MTDIPKLVHTSFVDGYSCEWFEVVDDDNLKYVGKFSYDSLSSPVAVFVSQDWVEEDVEEFGWNSLEEMFDDYFKNCLRDLV